MPEASHPHGHSGPPAPTVAPSQQVTTTRPGRPSQRLVLSPAVKARRNGLWLPAQLTIEDWSEIGMQIATIGDSSAWWLGDWLVYGKKKYPDRYKQAISATALDYQTLRNYAWVCRQFPVPRRRPTLSFQHHAELASLTPTCKTNGSTRQRHSAGHSTPSAASSTPGAVGRRKRKDGHLTLKLPATHIQQERWRLAATATGADIEKWIVMTLDDAAETQEPKNAENLEERTTS